MPSLSNKSWRRWDLGIGDNLQRPESDRAFVEVRTGLTRLEIESFATAMGEARSDADALCRAVAPFARLGVHFDLDGRQIATIEDLIRAGIEESAASILLEVSGAIRYWNSVSASSALFTERLSGGDTGTASKRG